MNYDELSKNLQSIAKQAGALMLGSDTAADRESDDKTNTKDFVTVTDIKAQNLMTMQLKEKYPSVAIVGEEDTEELRATLYNPDFTGFVLDPIDGTYNFKRDMRESGVSIGYIENGTPKVGVAFDPYKNEMFRAIDGKGAFKNDEPINVTSQARIEGAAIMITNSYDDTAMARNMRRQLAIYEKAGTMPWFNCPGSGVLAMCYVACGRFDMYHHNGTKPWDNAAAFLIVREAGGQIQTLRGDEAPFTTSNFVMGNPGLVGVVRQVFAQIEPELLT